MYQPGSIRYARGKTIEKILDLSQDGFKIETYGKNFGKGAVKGFNSRSGILEFWFRGHLEREIIIIKTRSKKNIMDQIIKELIHLTGEKYFVWKPNE